MKAHNVDRIFLLISCALITVGILVYLSASLGEIARSGESMFSLVFNQLALGLLGGSIVAFLIIKIDFRKLKGWSIYLFIISILLTLIVFVPSIGFKHGGATRWIDLGLFTFQ